MSEVSTPRPSRTASSSSPKSSPTGPTTWISEKKLAARAKWTAEPPSIRSRSPNGLLTESKAIDPTTVRDMAVERRGRDRTTAGCLVRETGRVKAIQISEFGGPEVLEHTELPDPEPGDGEVLVRVA